MLPSFSSFRSALILFAAIAFPSSAFAADGFPFGMDLTLDTAPMAGSKRVPTLDIGPSGQVQMQLWCKVGTGQFSVAGDTVVFIAGTLDNPGCPDDRAHADDNLYGALSGITNWQRQGDVVTFTGSKTLRFQLLTN